MRSPGRIVVLSLAAALVAAAGVTAVPATSAVNAPAAALPRSAPDGKLGSFSALGQGIYNPDDTTAYPYVRSVIRWDGKIIAGYDDSAMASGVAGTRSIAAWYDDTWHALGTGTSVGSGAGNYGVFALNAFTDDTLVAAGSFQNASGVTGTTNLAAWSKVGGNWRSLGGTVTNDAYALAKWTDDTLIVAGTFNTTAPSTGGTNHVAGWSRGTWHSFGVGVTLNGGQGDADALAPWTDDTFVVGGYFDIASGVANTRRIAAWSNVDDTWHPLGRGVDDTYIPPTSFSSGYNISSVDALAVWVDGDDTKLVAGGIFSSASGVARTNNIAVWSNLDDTWHSLGGGLMSPDPQARVLSLAVDDARDLIYAGGSFDRVTGGGFRSLNGIGVWDAGISTWIPLRFDTLTPWDNGIPEFGVHSILVEDAVVYVGGEIRKAGRVASANGIAKWTWQPPQGSSTFTTLGTAVTGEGLVGVPATGGVKVGTATATYTRDDSTHITITSIAGSPAAGAQITVNGVGGWGVVGTCAPPACADPNPPAPIPPSAPGSATATAGDASATVTWTAPTAPGSFPVTNYQVTSSPGDRSCLTSALTCTVTGLTNGTTYTFTVKALSGAGWGASSTPSNAVTPTGVPKPSIMITGSRDGQRITVTGTSMHLTSQTVRPWLRFPGETTYSEGAAVIPVNANGTFTWSRKTGKKAYVYVAHGTTKSNTVTIPAR
jgi:hypothetical protein